MHKEVRLGISCLERRDWNEQLLVKGGFDVQEVPSPRGAPGWGQGA